MKALLFCFLFGNLAFATTKISSSIINFERSSISPNVFYLFLDSGEILQADGKLKSIKNYLKKNNFFLFEFDSDHKLIRATPLQLKNDSPLREFKFVEDDYMPSSLSHDQLEENFNFFRKGARRFSQCFNRAHVWAYESKETFNINSMKVFLFFTKKFIRENDYKWWFHVAPANYLKPPFQNQLIVLDPYFTPKPLSVNDWAKHFVSKKINCLEASYFSEYELNQEKESCLIIKSTMYYLQPKDLKALEERNESKNFWLKGEIQRAYRNGFGIWRKEFIQGEETTTDSLPN